MTPADRIAAIEQRIKDEKTGFGNFAYSSEIIQGKSDVEWLISRVRKLTSALEKIANHKQTSVDKVYLIVQCEAYQAIAHKALEDNE